MSFVRIWVHAVFSTKNREPGEKFPALWGRRRAAQHHDRARPPGGVNLPGRLPWRASRLVAGIARLDDAERRMAIEDHKDLESHTREMAANTDDVSGELLLAYLVPIDMAT